MSENLLSIIPSLQVTSEEVREAELLAQQYLGALYPSVDFRPGLAIYDQVIRPVGTMIAVVNKGVELLFQNNTVEGITDETPKEFVDKLMSNHFMARRIGASSTVMARLYFLRQKDVYISPSYFFSTNNTEMFYPVLDKSYAASEMQTSYEEEAIGPFFLDVELQSGGEGEEYNISAGSLLYFTVFDPFFAGGNILYLKSTSIEEEANTAFVSRTEASLSTRNLINLPSIEERVFSVFNYFNEVEAVGFGEEEMKRDKADVISRTSPGRSSTIHLGGKTDVYVDADLEWKTQVEVTVQPYSETDDRLGIHLYGPIVDFEVSPTPAENLVPPTSYADVALLLSWGFEMIRDDYENDTGFSGRQHTFVALSSYERSDGVREDFVLGDKFFVNLEQFFGVDSLQAYLDDRLTRVIAADYLARAMEPCQLTVNIEIVERSSTDTEEDYEGLAQDLIETYLDSLGNGGTFSMAEFITSLQSGGVSGMSIPLDVSYRHLRRNGSGPSTGVITDTLELDRLSRFTLEAVSVTFVDEET
jgi:hypothetical protein